MITIQPVPNLKDNYAWLLREAAAAPSPSSTRPKLAPVAAAIEAAGGRLDLILLTHHHHDHIGAAERFRAVMVPAPIAGAPGRRPSPARAGCGPRRGRCGDARGNGRTGHRNPRATRGGTSPSTSPKAGALFCGDTLFSLGCGRLLEGTAGEMFGSLAKLAALPPETMIYCGHEYTEANARFALAADPDNAALRAYAGKVRAWRAASKPTVPSRLADELAANPFLRAKDVAGFADLRARKDRF